ncbi:MAG: hypothetical protein WBE34_05985 [Candidatus Nitrosopolaris sp.]
MISSQLSESASANSSDIIISYSIIINNVFRRTNNSNVVVVVDILAFVIGTHNIDRGSSFGFNRSSSWF